MTEVRRDVPWERQMTHHVATGLSVDASELVRFSEARAQAGRDEYGFDFPDFSTRNLPHETLEELADARNYLVWSLDAIRRDLGGSSGDGWRVDRFQTALRHVVLAFEEVRRSLA